MRLILPRKAIRQVGFFAMLLAFVFSSTAAIFPVQCKNEVITNPNTSVAAAGRLSNGLALTPPMGFNNWARYKCDADFKESTFTKTADSLVSKGLAAKGYVYVTVDDCWMTKERDGSGNLVVDNLKFPHGMKWLGDYLHKRGLKFGIYQDGGTETCAGYPGSYGHFQQDAKQFAGWGVDYIKFDFCNAPPTPEGMTYESFTRQIYSEMSDAITSTGRPMIFSESAPAYFVDSPEYSTVMNWVGQYGNLWRVTNDIPNHGSSDKWLGVMSNYEGTISLTDYAAPGNWNDPDFLIIGDDDNGLTAAEQRTQMSLWSIMAAPLILSTNVPTLSQNALDILGNTDVIAIDQDSLGIQGTRVQTDGGVDVIVKHLSNGDVAVALFNKDNPETVVGSVAVDAIGLQSPGCYAIKNLWTGKTAKITDKISASLGEHAAALLRVSQSKGCGATDPTATPPGFTSVEGESGVFSGAAKAGGCLGCSGGRLAGYIGGGKDNTLTITIDAKDGGTKTLVIYYVVEGTRILFISVNDDAGAPFDLTSASWTRPASISLSADLKPGENTFRFYNDTDFAPSIDRITIQ